MALFLMEIGKKVFLKGRASANIQIRVRMKASGRKVSPTVWARKPCRTAQRLMGAGSRAKPEAMESKYSRTAQSLKVNGKSRASFRASANFPTARSMMASGTKASQRDME